MARIVPSYEGIAVPLEDNRIRWQHRYEVVEPGLYCTLVYDRQRHCGREFCCKGRWDCPLNVRYVWSRVRFGIWLDMR